MYQLQLMAAAAYLLLHSGSDPDPLALAKEPPSAPGEESGVLNSGSQRRLVARAAGIGAVEGQALK